MTDRKSLRSRITSLLRHTGGNTLMLVGLAMVPLVGTVGIGIDVAQWVVWKRQLHTAADLGALAGARALADGQPVKVNVERSLAHNKLRKFSTLAIENAPTAGPFKDDPDKVRVVLSTTEPLPFSGWFLNAAPAIQVEAVAENAKTTPNCVITLDRTGTGVSITGSSTVNMNCGLSSNSNFDATSSDYIKAGALSAVGTVTTGGAITGDTKINDGITEVSDPFAGRLPVPNTQSSCSPNTYPLIKSDMTIGPVGGGIICYQGLQIQSGIVDLRPGTYFIGASGISVSAKATLRGSGVTLIFTNTESSFNSSKVGSFWAAGGATINLSAASSGTYAGVLMYVDPRTPAKNNTLQITGNSDSSLQGTIYAPSVEVRMIGNSEIDGSAGIDTPCMQIVALYATFTGNTSVTNECPSGSGASSFGGQGTVRLVG